MGIVTAGIPEEIVVELARLNNATIFVETGTLHGATTKWASNYFESVHTIERAENLFNMHRDELSRIKGVTPYLGDSRDRLPEIVTSIGDEKAVYWLDGHWSGGDTAGAQDECPLMDELACLQDRTEDIILIDDAHLFLCAPPLPHNPLQWPGITEIINAVQAHGGNPFIQIINDVIYIVPDKNDIKRHLVEYAQQHGGQLWDYVRSKHGSFGKVSDRLKSFMMRNKQ